MLAGIDSGRWEAHVHVVEVMKSNNTSDHNRSLVGFRAAVWLTKWLSQWLG